MVVIGMLLTIGTAMFVMAEFSLVALDIAKVEQEDLNDRRNRMVLHALHNLSTGLSSAQIGITITTVLLGYTAQIALSELFRKLFEDLGISYAISLTRGIIIAIVIVNLFSMIFGELIPKNIAIALPLVIARRIIIFHNIFTKIFFPIIVILNFIANSILHIFGIEIVEHLSTSRNAKELSSIVKTSARQGAIDKSTANIVSNSLNIEDLQAMDIMTDRGRVVWINKDQTAQEVIELARKTGHSRFPVYDGNYDNILGIVNLRKVMNIEYSKRCTTRVCSKWLLTPVYRVPETIDIKPLIVELRSAGQQVALVVDEYGGTSGIVTLEDAVEEIIGEVSDEYDSRRLGIQKGASNTWLVPGYVRPDELEKKLCISFPEEDGPYETVAGLFLYKYGQIPIVGDQVKIGKICLKVESMKVRRIEYLRVSVEDQ